MSYDKQDRKRLLGERRRLAVERARRRYRRSGFTVHEGDGEHEASDDLDGIQALPDLVACRGPSNEREKRLVFVTTGWPDPDERRLTGPCRDLARRKPDLHVDVFPYSPGLLASPPPAESVTRLIEEARQALNATPVAALLTARKATEQALFRMTCAQGESYERAPQLEMSMVSDLEYSYVPDSELAQLRRFVKEYERVMVDGGSGPVAVDLVSWAIEFAEIANQGAPPPVDDLVNWFLEHYETPEDAELPIAVATGGYVWPSDGPADARTVLAEQFPDAWASSLDDAVRIIEADGVLRWVRRDTRTGEVNDTSGAERNGAWERRTASAAGRARVAGSEGRRVGREVEAVLVSPASEPGMLPSTDGLGLVSRHHLVQWADREDAPTVFPELIRRLIIETSTGARVDMPSGRGVQQPGWDGIVNCPDTTAHVPAGRSVWELSTAKDFKRKATDDYKKRTAKHRDDPAWRNETAYVAVSLRPWPKCRAWEDKRQAEGDWREVRAYGLDRIDAWLQSAANTRVWLSEHLGLTPHGFESGRARWERRLGETGGLIDQSVILAGRSAEAASFRRSMGSAYDAISNQPASTGPATTGLASQLAVEGDSVQEVCDFVCAAVAERPEELARMLFVSEQPAWNRLLREPGRLVLVPTNPRLAAKAPAGSDQLRHHIVIPVDRTGTSDHTPTANLRAPQEPIRLPRLAAPRQVAEALEAKGRPFSEAQRLSSLARRSYAAFRRELVVAPVLPAPAWNNAVKEAGNRPKVAAAVLAGAWDEENEHDQCALSRLVSSDARYDDLRPCLEQLADSDDPLLARVGAHWNVAAPGEAWHEATRLKLVRQPALNRLGDVIAQVLGERGRGHSPGLRKGLARTLALIGAHGLGDTLSLGGDDVTFRASEQVWRLIRQPSDASSSETLAAEGVLRRLSDLGDVLPLLGEAAPDSVLEALLVVLDGDPAVARHLLRDGPRSWLASNSPSRREAVLWTLERIAWSSDHLSEVADMLWRLHEMETDEPISRPISRPLAALRAIFCLWLPHTGAGLKDRLRVLAGLVKRHPDAAAGLLPELIPRRGESVFPTQRARFRDWSLGIRRPSSAEISDSLREIAELAIKTAAEKADRDLASLLRLVDHACDLPPPARQLLWKSLEASSEQDEFDREEAERAWSCLDKFIRMNRGNPDRGWALPNDELERLEAVAERWSPQDPVQTAAWLFSDYYPESQHKPSAGEGSWEAYNAWLRPQRIAAVRQVLLCGGLRSVQALAKKDRRGLSWMVGLALARACAPSSETVTSEETAAPEETVASDGSGQCTETRRADSHAIGHPIAAEQAEELDRAVAGSLREPESAAVKEMARAYIGERFAQAGDQAWQWLAGLGEGADADPALQAELIALQAELIAATCDHPRDWQEAEKLGKTVADKYWRLFKPLALAGKPRYAKHAARRLMDVGRHRAAIELLGFNAYDASEDSRSEEFEGGGLEEFGLLAVEALEGLADRLDRNGSRRLEADQTIFPHLIQKLFELLASVWPVTKESLDDETGIRIAKLQFSFLEMLTAAEEQCQLHDRLAVDPAFFVDCVKVLYRPESQPHADRPEETPTRSAGDEHLIRARATASAHLLIDWKQVPGQTASGEIDTEELTRWVRQTREKLAEADRIHVGDDHIGAVLGASYHAGGDGLPEAVCGLLEELRNRNIENGVWRGILNGLGVSCRAPGDGGEQERKLADRLRSEAFLMAADWPRAARILRQVAESYDRQARLFDLEDERVLSDD